MSELLATVEIEPAADADSSVIWLHGLGADGHDFESVVPHLGVTHATRFVFPHAPSIPVTINNGFVMPAWYDILEMTLDRRVDETQLRQSAEAVRRLIARENARGIDSERIVVAGFSQGGAVAFELALTHPERLAGLVALSTYFATRDSIALANANRGLPVFIGHGLRDPVVPASYGEASLKALSELDFPVDYRVYPVEHGVDLDEIHDIGAFINTCLGGA